MKRMTYFVMALALVLGLAQCKKEQPETPQNEGNSVMITLDVKSDNNAKVDVDPPHVTFEAGDEIIVACNGHYVGTLKHNETNFSGYIENATPGEHLYFYFFGNVSPQYFDTHKYECSVYIGEQTGKLPVISMGQSKETVPSDPSERSNYTAILQNKCSLMKFNADINSTAPLCISGMNNFVTVRFNRSGDDGFIDGFKYSKVYNGVIKMAGLTDGNTETWAIVLPQEGPIAAGNAYTEDYGYIGMRPAIEGGIGINQYYSDGVTMIMESFDPLAIPLTFEAKTAGATVTLDRAGDDYENAPDVSLMAYIDGHGWTTYSVGDNITLANEGDKVMFYATNNNLRFAKSPEACHTFSIDDGYCYVYGNIMSLIDRYNYAGNTALNSMADYTFESLFADCTGLCNHPQKPLELPATELAPYCYSHMFSGCVNLFVAPKLPARDLTTGCYQSMFESSGLEESPVLHAPTLVLNCYASMFNNCSGLNRVTCLAETGINDLSSTSSWMSGVASRGTFIKAAGVPVEGDEVQLTVGLYWPRGENGIPINWTVEN